MCQCDTTIIKNFQCIPLHTFGFIILIKNKENKKTKLSIKLKFNDKKINTKLKISEQVRRGMKTRKVLIEIIKNKKENIYK